MSIVQSELKWYKSKVVTNTPSNGGKMSTVNIVGGVKNNIFPDVSQAERIAGMIRYRKIFAKLTNAADEVLINPGLHVKQFTPAQDRVEIFMATQTDTQNDIVGSERKYGAGFLTTGVAAGATVCTLTLEDASQAIFDTSGTNDIYISDGTNQEYHTGVTATQAGDQVTLTLASGHMFANTYVHTTTVVASVIYGTITELEPTSDAMTVSSAGDGAYDESTATGTPLEGSNIGAVEDTFTLTFTSGTAFDCVGSESGSVGSGNTSSDFAPINSDFSVAYFTLRSGGWTGTWASGDTLVIDTHPAGIPMWAKQTVPAGCNSFSGDNFILRFGGESA